MKVAILSNFKKILNSTINIGFAGFALLWCIIGLLGIFTPNAEIITAYLMICSALCLIVIISAGLVSWLLKPTIHLNTGSSYILSLNTGNNVENIKEKNDIAFLKNFLYVKDSFKPIAEISNAEAFKLLQSDLRESLTINVKKQQTKYLEQSPKALIDSFMRMLWTAS